MIIVTDYWDFRPKAETPVQGYLDILLGLRPKAKKKGTRILRLRPKTENFREIVYKNIGARSAPKIFGVFYRGEFIFEWNISTFFHNAFFYP